MLMMLMMSMMLTMLTMLMMLTMMMFTIVELAPSVGETNEVTNICRSLDKAALPLQCKKLFEQNSAVSRTVVPSAFLQCFAFVPKLTQNFVQ